MPGENANPTPTTRLNPASASACTFWSRSEPVALASFVTTFSSQTRPSAIALLQTGVGRVVERLVAEAADVERDTDLDVGVALGAGRAAWRPSLPVAPLAPELSSLLLHAAATSPIKSSGTANRKKRLRIHFPSPSLPCPAG